MIHDVDASLRELVRREVLNGSNVDLSFEAPTREWGAKRKGPTLNLYLYDLTEDLKRRECNYEEVRDERGIVTDRRMPPRRFRLSYLVTAWTSRPEDEHRLLSAVLGCFVRGDVLPDDVLQGVLADQPRPVGVTIGLPLPKDRQLSDIWSALGGELKAALDLVVTAPVITDRDLPIGPLVVASPRVDVHGPGGLDETAGGRRQPPPGQPEREATSRPPARKRARGPAGP